MPRSEPIRAYDPLPPIDQTANATRQAIDQARAGELLGARELMAIFGMKHAQFAKLQKAGAFDRFLVPPPAIGRKCYAGLKVYRYLTDNPHYEPPPVRRSTDGFPDRSRS